MPDHETSPSPACTVCAAALAADQRYCLACGQRRAGRPQDDVALLVGECGGEPADAPGATAAGAIALPGTRMCAALAVALLGAGLALGGLVGPTDRSLADAGARRVVAVVGSPPAAMPPRRRPPRRRRPPTLRPPTGAPRA